MVIRVPLFIATGPRVSASWIGLTPPCRSVAPGTAYLTIERVGGMAMSDFDKSKRNIVDFVFCHNDLSGSNAFVDPHSFTVRAMVDWGTRTSTLPDSARLCHPRS